MEKTSGGLPLSLATLLVLLLLCLVVCFYQRTKALRGGGGQPLPPIVFLVDRLCRAVFVFALWAPLFLLLPSMIVWALFPPYLISFLDPAELRGGRPLSGKWVGIRFWPVWSLLKERLSLELVKTTELKKGQRYLFGLHPHGIMPWGAFFNVTTEINQFSKVFPSQDVRVAIVTIAFWVPIYRELALWGKVMDCSLPVVRRALESEKSVMLVPGGAPEGLKANPGRHSLVLRRRDGIFRLALETGTDLVPVYSFGDGSTYRQLVPEEKTIWGKLFLGAQDRIRSLIGIVIPVVLNVVPRKCKVATVFGAPVRVEGVVKEPTKEQIEELKERYVEALKRLFDDHKEKYAADRIEDLTIGW
uniref:Acyltransferase n=1 Tax=Chromera velia CCMP2878 TaxID=1169474 RepID=A0A0G4HRH9_9ALVE|eukprot:Cvel_30601.t1-p1 / transcript=Cvel_30601.t1 / gene=Cvel_30601 / organism=Chromera_velia_CCMP2878 / gene_product=2-acylglycerol O-acyltransferase 1, putative / transcript_product=2-acylglycerol O-acyltransferase 1, putative / location=Cvel_scaffold4388:2127-3200(+) / protein_length=358 / sequence_SO=supercontig / SO=protein_coding / is_pseudo=false